MYRKGFGLGLALLLVGSALAQGPKQTVLMAGADAPALSVGKWVKGAPVDSLAKGKVYVVEFWATWCGPCKVSIPHLTELQKKFTDVTFVGVSSFESDWTKVEPFVQSEGDQMDYHVAMDKVASPSDREGDMAKNWMEAAHQNGIPTAFVVDTDGKIAWIGHPMNLEDPLSKIVKGTWDRAAFIKQEQADIEKQQADEVKQAPVRKASAAYSAALKAKDWPGALKAADALADAAGHPEAKDNLHLNVYMASGNGVEFNKLARKLVTEAEKANSQDHAFTLNQIAWAIVDPKGNMKPKDLALAKEAAEKAVGMTERKQPEFLDTLAWTYHLSGQDKTAATLEAEALSKSDAAGKAQYAETLKTFQGSGDTTKAKS